MFCSDQYELVDFGEGEKLERFAGIYVRRETPAAKGAISDSLNWPTGCLRFRRNEVREIWTQAVSLPAPWLVRHHEIFLELRPTPFGHLGLFAEQAANWAWIRNAMGDLNGLKALNLFAYTGGTTLTLAARGAHVTHVDSSRTVVNWARANARHSGLESSPIRWIIEDVKKYVAREIKRGNRYDIVVADPPSFGRGPKNEIWKLEIDFGGLLQSLASLCRDNCAMVLISCHTPEFDSGRIAEMTAERFPLKNGSSDLLEMTLVSRDGRFLPNGSCFRWSIFDTHK